MIGDQSRLRLGNAGNFARSLPNSWALVPRVPQKHALGMLGREKFHPWN